MKIGCECGATIYDSTDFISYKCFFVSDQDADDFWDVVEGSIEKLGAKLTEPSFDRGATKPLVDETLRAIRVKTAKYRRRNIYQCTECGRLFVDDNDSQCQVFKPASDTVPKDLLRSCEGEKWKRHLGGLWKDWEKGPQKGELYWGFGVEDQGFEKFDDFDKLQTKYFEVFERLKAADVLRCASLRKGSDTIHRWPDATKNLGGSTTKSE